MLFAAFWCGGMVAIVALAALEFLGNDCELPAWVHMTTPLRVAAAVIIALFLWPGAFVWRLRRAYSEYQFRLSEPSRVERVELDPLGEELDDDEIPF